MNSFDHEGEISYFGEIDTESESDNDIEDFIKYSTKERNRNALKWRKQWMDLRCSRICQVRSSLQDYLDKLKFRNELSLEYDNDVRIYSNQKKRRRIHKDIDEKIFFGIEKNVKGKYDENPQEIQLLNLSAKASFLEPVTNPLVNINIANSHMDEEFLKQSQIKSYTFYPKHRQKKMKTHLLKPPKTPKTPKTPTSRTPKTPRTPRSISRNSTLNDIDNYVSVGVSIGVSSITEVKANEIVTPKFRQIEELKIDDDIDLDLMSDGSDENTDDEEYLRMHKTLEEKERKLSGRPTLDCEKKEKVVEKLTDFHNTNEYQNLIMNRKELKTKNEEIIQTQTRERTIDYSGNWLKRNAYPKYYSNNFEDSWKVISTNQNKIIFKRFIEID